MQDSKSPQSSRTKPEIKPTATGPPAEVIQMVKNLLADRFKLVAHTETREMPVCNLVLARPDGKLGPKMRPAEVDCAALMARGGPPPTTPPGQMPPCGTRISTGTLSGRGGAMAQIARTLAGLPSIARLVVDKAGLAGSFDIDLEWTENPSADTAGPSMFTALQEQLGLKLESARGPMDVLVIDGVEQPTADERRAVMHAQRLMATALVALLASPRLQRAQRAGRTRHIHEHPAPQSDSRISLKLDSASIPHRIDRQPPGARRRLVEV